MKDRISKYAVVGGFAAVMLVITGCTTPEGQPDRTATGALTGGAIGAGAGAIIGSASGHAGPGALIGGAIRALTGGIIGNAAWTYVRAAQDVSNGHTPPMTLAAPLTK